LKGLTLIERESRVPQLQEEHLSKINSEASSRNAGASKGEAVVAYRKPLAIPPWRERWGAIGFPALLGRS
jgi:hypothetical protein